MNKARFCKDCRNEIHEKDIVRNGGYIRNVCRDCWNGRKMNWYLKHHEKEIGKRKVRQKKHTDNLTDNYLKHKIHQALHIHKEDIPVELILAYRSFILLKRLKKV